jgi:hypothetical protein
MNSGLTRITRVLCLLLATAISAVLTGLRA